MSGDVDMPLARASSESSAARARTPMTTLSVVIPNFNYGAFVGDAVRSALAVALAGRGGRRGGGRLHRQISRRAARLRRPHHAHRPGECRSPSSVHRGFAVTRGDAVIFLDTDDVLEPSIARDVAEWRPGVSKGPGPDASDRPPRPGHRPAVPRLPAGADLGAGPALAPDDLGLPDPTGFGNEYARSFLERLFPLDDRCGDATDSACLAAAPFLGDVVTIARPLGAVPGSRRQSQQRALGHEPRRPCGGEAPIPGDSRARIAWDAMRSITASGPVFLPRRIAVAGGASWV